LPDRFSSGTILRIKVSGDFVSLAHYLYLDAKSMSTLPLLTVLEREMASVESAFSLFSGTQFALFPGGQSHSEVYAQNALPR